MPLLSEKRRRASLPRLQRRPPASPGQCARRGTALSPAWPPAWLLLSSNPRGSLGRETLPRDQKARVAPRTSSFCVAETTVQESPCGISTRPAARCELSQTGRPPLPSVSRGALRPTSPAALG